MGKDEFVRVPYEPDDKMLDAGEDAAMDWINSGSMEKQSLYVYRAMLAAAPSVEMEQQVNFSVLLVEKNERRNCERSLSQLLATNKLLRAALGESNGVLDAFSTQSQTAKYQLEENRKLLAPPESAQTEGDWHTDIEKARMHHAIHGDMEGSTCLLSECALHYLEAWKIAHPRQHTVCPQCGAGKEGV